MCVTDDSPPLMFLLNVWLVHIALASSSHGCADIKSQVDPVLSANLPCLKYTFQVRKQEELALENNIAVYLSSFMSIRNR